MDVKASFPVDFSAILGIAPICADQRIDFAERALLAQSYLHLARGHLRHCTMPSEVTDDGVKEGKRKRKRKRELRLIVTMYKQRARWNIYVEEEEEEEGYEEEKENEDEIVAACYLEMAQMSYR